MMNDAPANAAVVQTNDQRNESQTSGYNPFRAISNWFWFNWFNWFNWFLQRFTSTTKREPSIAVKRQPKNPKTFPFITLPLPCKSLVLDCADVGETCNFLKTNKYLREEAQHRGPFRGKIAQIDVSFDLKTFVHEPTQCLVMIYHFLLSVHLHKRTVAKFSIADEMLEIGDDTLPDPKLGQYLWTLVNKTRYCKVVKIKLGSFPFGDKRINDCIRHSDRLSLNVEQDCEAALREVFDGNRFLPLLRQSAFFRYHGAGMMRSKIFFDNFDRPVNDSFFIDLQWKGEENKEAQDYLEMLLTRPNYKECKFYEFNRRPFTAQLWKSFTKTNMRMLISEGSDWDDFQESMKIFLKLGIPSKKDHAVVEVRLRRIEWSDSTLQWEKTPEEIFADLMDLIHNFEGLEKIHELSMEAKEIIEFDQKFNKRNKHRFESPFKEEEVTARHENKAMYKKRINRERECVFMATITAKREENIGDLDVRCVMKNLPNYRGNE